MAGEGQSRPGGLEPACRHDCLMPRTFRNERYAAWLATGNSTRMAGAIACWKAEQA
jgi:hypothetical protein